MAKRNARKIEIPNLEPLECLPGFLVGSRIITTKRADEILGTVRQLAQCLLQMSDRIEYLETCIDQAAKHAGDNHAAIDRIMSKIKIEGRHTMSPTCPCELCKSVTWGP